jgi:hypothetical protein
MQLRSRGGCRATLGTFGLAVVALAAQACGSSATRYPDASVDFDAKGDAPRVDTGTTTPDAGSPPVVGPGSRALVTGPALLVGNGPDSCTNQEQATGDRWCAFARPSTFLGATDLWVVNVSKAAAGTSIKCDASDLNCLLLTSSLNDSSLAIHRFFGDTLIYYADSGARSGPAYGWRPGMTAGRKLIGAAGLQCIGHTKTDTVLCFDNADDTTVAGQTSVDVIAGSMSAGGTALLPKVSTILVSLATDATNLRKYQVGLSAGGDWVAWSARPTAAGVETLYAQKVNDDSSRVTIAEDVSRWAFSRDGAKWYWLKTYNYGLTAPPLGTLQMANFPTDTGGVAPVATTVKTSVASFSPAGDKGLAYFGPLNATTGLGELLLMGDRDLPAQAKSIDTRAVRLLSLSRDGRTMIYAKTGATDTSGTVTYFDLNVGGLDVTSPCVLTPTANSPPPYATLSDGATTAYWSYGDNVTGEFVGQYTTIAGCSSHKFSSDLWLWTSVQDLGVVFADTFVPISQTDVSVTLRYSSFSGTSLPVVGTVVQERASSTFSVLLPNLAAVVYTIFTGGATDGVYLTAGLPFPTSP